MPDRLAQLQRQRALLQEHLTWLEAEIARELGQSSAPESSPLPDASATPNRRPNPFRATAPALLSEAGEAIADRALEDYRQPKESIQADVKKGCLLYFAAAFALLGLAVFALYLYSRARH